MDKDTTKCASCGKTDLQHGKCGVEKHTFMPGEKMMMMGYVLEARACLDCGFVGHYLSRSDIEKIKQRRA